MRTKLKTAVCIALAFTVAAALGGRHASGAEQNSRDGTQSQTGMSVAQTGFGLETWSVDAGGGISTGGTFAVVAAVGQPDTGLANACGRVLDGGVWAASVDLRPLFCDGFETGGTGNWGAENPITKPTDDSQASGGK